MNWDTIELLLVCQENRRTGVAADFNIDISGADLKETSKLHATTTSTTCDTRLTNNFADPVRRRPAPRGAGRRPGRHVSRTLTRVRTLAGRAVVCSACPGRRRAGWPRATTHGPQPATDLAASRSRSAPAGGKDAELLRSRRLALRRGVTAAPRRLARPAGCRPHKDQRALGPVVRSGGPGPPAIRASRWASVWPPRSAERSGGQAPKRRRVRPVSGRLEDVQKVCTNLILPAAGRSLPTCPG